MILYALNDIMLPYLEWKTEIMGVQEIKYLNFLVNNGSKEFCNKYSESLLNDLFERYIKFNEYFIDNFIMYIKWIVVLKELSENKDYNTLSIILNRYRDRICKDLINDTTYSYLKNNTDIQFILKFDDYYYNLIVNLLLNYIHEYHLDDINNYLDFDKNIIKINGNIITYTHNLEYEFMREINNINNVLDIFERNKNYKMIQKIIYNRGNNNNKSDILKYNNLLDWKVLTRKMITNDTSIREFNHILYEYHKYLDWDYVSRVFKNTKRIDIINKYIKYINKDLFNANNKIFNINEDNTISYKNNIIDNDVSDDSLLSKRIRIGIPRKDALKLKNSRYFEYKGKNFDITDDNLLYTICKKLDKNYYFYQAKMNKEHLKILEVLDKYYNYGIGDIDISNTKSINMIKGYNHFISENEKDIIWNILKCNHIVEKDKVLDIIEEIHKLYKPFTDIFVSVPKIEKRKTEDIESSKWNIIKVEISVKTFVDRTIFINKINKLKSELLKFIMYFISNKDNEISVMINYLKPYNCIITRDRILHIEFIIDERLEKIL